MEAARGDDSKHGEIRNDTTQQNQVKVSAEFGKTDHSRYIKDSENYLGKSDLVR